MLGPAEAPAQWKILPQRKSLLVRLPHENTAQVRMTLESNAEHVVALALQPIRRTVDVVNAVDLQRLPFGKLGFDAKEATKRKRAKVPHDFDRHFSIAIFDGRDVAEVVVLL